MSQNQKKIYFIENPEFSESDIEEIECGCFTWSNEIFEFTRENAKLRSIVKKLAHRAAGQDGMAMDVALGIISEFSENCIKLSVPLACTTGGLSSIKKKLAIVPLVVTLGVAVALFVLF